MTRWVCLSICAVVTLLNAVFHWQPITNDEIAAMVFIAALYIMWHVSAETAPGKGAN